MDNAKLGAVVQRLIDRTRKNEVDWQSTEKRDTFQAAFANASIRLSKPNAALLQIDVYNEEGTLIDSATDEDLVAYISNGAFTEMKEMFNLARRRAMGVDDTLNALLSELDVPRQ